MIIDMSKLPAGCVFSIVDESGRAVYINYSLNPMLALSRIWGELSARGSALEFSVVSVATDIETLKLHTEYWREKYRARGYSDLIGVGRSTLQYEVRCLVNADYTGVDVVLVTARGDRKVVGKFETMAEGRLFIETCYGEDNALKLPVYANNSRTSEYLSQSDNKIDINL